MSTLARRPLYEIEAGKKYAAKRKRAAAKTARKGTQAQRQASRSPGGWQEGGVVENYNDQVKRKYGGGKL